MPHVVSSPCKNPLHPTLAAHIHEWSLTAVGYYLPILSRAISSHLNCSDYNIVQNNGLRAAQVVPHVHFHIIPRPESRLPSVNARSWTMFGRGLREDLDWDEAEELARGFRSSVRTEIRKIEGETADGERAERMKGSNGREKGSL
jgi:diadenosine tetraphosphate (Ap4A) HIT family hydrolase